MDHLWLALTALATLAIAVTGVFHFVRPLRKHRLFFSIQMKNLTDTEYATIKHRIEPTIDQAAAMKCIGHVYYFNRNVPNHASFQEEQFPIQMYMDELDSCDYFFAIIIKPVLSSIYFEAGHALASGKRCVIYALRGLDVLPTVMRLAAHIEDHVCVVECDDLDDIVHKLHERVKRLGEGKRHGPNKPSEGTR